MKRISALFVLIFLFSIITAIPTNAKQPILVHDAQYHFTQIRGILGGADYEILMPDSWNGMLVVECRGYSHLESEITSTSSMHLIGVGFVSAQPSNNIAIAWSNFGDGGWCIKEGIIRTHQLTEYVIDNYHVTGKVLLFGASMGGEVACLLGEKYPNLYDGVLDECGVKDLADFYTICQTETKNDIIAECGGTPESKPQAYEQLSPIYHADITIPVISIIGKLDNTVPIRQFEAYYDSVKAAGSSNYYRNYVVASGHHCDGPVILAISPNFVKLLNWVITGNGPLTGTSRP
jgi:hypothetical protein